jgi:transcriptional regulator of heat shock response
VEEEWQNNQLAEFANQLNQLYDIKEVTEAREEEEQKVEEFGHIKEPSRKVVINDADIVLEDIIDDLAVDALELHDSDDSGADLQ